MRTNTLIRSTVLALVAVATMFVAPSASASPATARATGESLHWEISSAGTLSSGAHLSSVSSAGRHAAWAVGHQRFDGVADGVVLKWNGREWSQDRTAGLPQVEYWHSVSAVSPYDVWVYGWSQTGETAAHYNGWRWQRIDLPELPDGAIHGFSELAAVHGRTWLAGDHRISTYANGTWRTTDLGSGFGITDIHARSAFDAWAVGGYSRVGEKSRPVALHWNGRSWSEVSLPDARLRLTNVYAESRHSVWVSGHTTDGYQPKVLHWNGKTWQDVTGPVEGLAPQALSGDRHGRIWLSGDPAGWEGAPVFWRYDGKRWTRVHGATVPGGETQSYTVTDLAPIGRTGRHWAVGSYELLDGQGGAGNYEFIQRATR
jgi:hypothetical protein